MAFFLFGATAPFFLRAQEPPTPIDLNEVVRLGEDIRETSTQLGGSTTKPASPNSNDAYRKALTNLFMVAYSKELRGKKSVKVIETSMPLAGFLYPGTRKAMTESTFVSSEEFDSFKATLSAYSREADRRTWVTFRKVEFSDPKLKSAWDEYVFALRREREKEMRHYRRDEEYADGQRTIFSRTANRLGRALIELGSSTGGVFRRQSNLPPQLERPSIYESEQITTALSQLSPEDRDAAIEKILFNSAESDLVEIERTISLGRFETDEQGGDIGIQLSIGKPMDADKFLTSHLSLDLSEFLPLLPRDSLSTILDRLTQFEIRGATYNGETFHIEYADKEVEKHVEKLAQMVWAVGAISRVDPTAIPASLKEKLLRNTNTDDPTTRVELFDLLAHQVRDTLSHSLPSGSIKLDPITLSAVARTVVRTALNAPPSSDDLPVAIFRDKNDSSLIHLVCAAGKMRLLGSDRLEDAYSSSSQQIFSHTSVKIDSEESALVVRCGKNIYQIEVEVKKTGGVISKPKTLNFSNAFATNEFNVLSTFAVTDDFSESSFKAFLAYMASKGYRPTSVEPVEDTRKMFGEDFKRSDLYLPTAHSISLNAFQIGSEQSTRVLLERAIPHPQKNGEMMKVKMAIYFPRINGGGSADIRLEQSDLAALLCQRREVRDNPLAVVTMSCSSDESPAGWMYAYQKSLHNEKGELNVELSKLNDVPFIIGTERGFDTSSAVALMANMDFAFDAIDAVAGGKTPEEILHVLSIPPEQTKLNVALSKLEGLFHGKTHVNAARPYNPVCNIQRDDLFDLKDVGPIWLKNLAKPEEKYSY